MTEFIPKDKAVEACFDGWNNNAHDCAENIRSIPAADLWEVVHCADCAHAEESLVSGCVYCNEMERARIKEGFCAWGERKTKHG